MVNSWDGLSLIRKLYDAGLDVCLCCADILAEDINKVKIIILFISRINCHPDNKTPLYLYFVACVHFRFHRPAKEGSGLV
tara:strand:+ start:476 stop:715 length:240 start_codon:yes stop_codon:yes gene_type:complete